MTPGTLDLLYSPQNLVLASSVAVRLPLSFHLGLGTDHDIKKFFPDFRQRGTVHRVPRLNNQSQCADEFHFLLLCWFGSLKKIPVEYCAIPKVHICHIL